MPSPKAVGLALEESGRRNAEAVDTIAEVLGIDRPEAVREKSGQMQTIREAAALADFLERVADAIGDRPAEPAPTEAAQSDETPQPDEAPAPPEKAEPAPTAPDTDETEPEPAKPTTRPRSRSRSRKATNK